MHPPTGYVARFDVSTIGKPERTPQGFLRVPAFLTRAGVLVYKRADGVVVRELRSPEEVFAPASLASLAAAPVTDLHPTQMVSPANVRKLAIGHVSEQVRQDGHLVAAHVTVQDAEAIKRVESGARREVSMGYRCRIDATPGVFEGERYDVQQRDIVYNHAALGPRNWGRAGSDVALRIDAADGGDDDREDDDDQDEQVFRLDAQGALATTTTDAPPDRRADDDDDPLEDNMDQVTIRVDGLDVTVPKQWAQVIEKGIKDRTDSIAQLTVARDQLQGKLDAVTADLEKTKLQLTAAQDPKRLDAAVNERGALLEQAKRVLPADYKYDGLTPVQIHTAVLTKLDDKLDLKGRSEEYVAARFDHAISSLPPEDEQHRSDALSNARRLTDGNPPPVPPAQTRQDAAPYVAPWQRPLAVSKDAR